MSKQVRAGERIDALTRHNRPIRSEVDILSRAFAPRQNPHPAPPLTISEAPAVCLIVNMSWVSHVIGVLETLNQPDAWAGDDDEKHRAQNEIQLLIEMLMTGDACMVDPCCPETNELLIDIKVLNQTLIENQLTIINNQEITIDNDTTIINQNTQEILNQYQNTLNNWVTTNQNTAIYNSQIYDGNPQSIAPSLGINFEDTTTGALCAAIKRYVDNIVTTYTTMANLLAAGAGLVAGVVAAAIIAATLGAAAPLVGAWGVILSGLSFTTLGLWNVAANDMEARRKVYCCMYDSLNGQAITYANFQASVADCGFDSGSSQGRVAKLIDEQSSEANYLAFLRMLGETVGGNEQDCVCDCDDAATLEDYYGSGCVITPVGNCVYRFTQATPDGTGKYFYSFQDILSRCLLVENSPDPAYPTVGVGTNTFVTDCDGVEGAEFPGGMTGGTLQATRWWQGGDTGGFQHFKITLAE